MKRLLYLTLILLSFLQAMAQLGQTYVDPTYSFSIRPPQGWQRSYALEQRMTGMGQQGVIFSPGTASHSFLLINTQPVASTVVNDQAYEQTLDGFKRGAEQTPNLHVSGLISHIHTVNGLKVCDFQCRMQVRNGMTNHYGRFILADRRLYSLDMITTISLSAAQHGILDRSFDSFRPKGPNSQNNTKNIIIGIIVCFGIPLIAFIVVIIAVVIYIRRGRASEQIPRY